MKYRVSDIVKYNIIENNAFPEDLDKLSFDLNCDLFQDLRMIFEKIDFKENKVIKYLLNYFLEIYKSMIYVSQEPFDISYNILLRTLIEIYIVTLYLVYSEEEDIYDKYIMDGLLSMKFYYNSIKDDCTEPKFKEGTIKSFEKLLNDSNFSMEDLDNFSKSKIKFPCLESMVNNLTEKNIVSKRIYDIVYRSYSGFVHAKWDAIQMFNERPSDHYVKVESICGDAILTIHLFKCILEKYLLGDEKNNCISELNNYNVLFKKIWDKKLLIIGRL